MRNGHSDVRGQIVNPPVNKNRAGLGFSMKNDKGKGMKLKSAAGKYQVIFRSGGYLHFTVSGINAIMEDEAEPEMLQNWVTIDVPSCIHVSK